MKIIARNSSPLPVGSRGPNFPSFTTSGRLRAELRSDARRELINDLFWSLSIYESYDSDPVGVGAAGNDLVVTASLGWKL